MKCIIPEIHWHGQKPVLSVDLQPKIDEFLRLATGGSDSHVVIWYIHKDVEADLVRLEPAADLAHHQKAVNVVRWAPSGEFLASGDDEANIILWKQRIGISLPSLDPDVDEFKETWITYRVLRGHNHEIYDLSWSPDSTHVLSGSVDNTVISWNLTKTTKDIIDGGHKGFVQGVAWDPLNKYLSTLSSDRVCRVLNATTKRVISRSSKGRIPVPKTHSLYGQTVRLYHDDTLKSFFRRLCFSPDGQLLIVPSGCVETEDPNKKIHCAFIYIRGAFKEPVLALPSADQYTIAVRCCPLLFKLRENGPTPVIPLPYRMIIALATYSSVIFYDTQQMQPFAAVSNINYTRTTDLTWSDDGLVVVVSSTDGFCSIVTFEEGELGTVYVPSETVIPINTDMKEINATQESSVECLLFEDIAQDKWNKSLENESKMDVDEPVILSDDATEDFKLVIEDSTIDDDLKIKTSVTTEKLYASQNEVTGIKTLTEISPLTAEEKDGELIKPEADSKKDTIMNENIDPEKEGNHEVVSNALISVLDNVNDDIDKKISPENSCDVDSASEKTIITPRRVALITISSPKSRKKIL